MNCIECQNSTKKHGKDRNGNQRFRCLACGKTFIEPKVKPLGTMTLAEDKAILCLQLLVEGNSVRSCERISGVNRNTILSLLEVVGKKCLWIQENLIRNVQVKFIEADEIWSFVAMKDKAKHAKEIQDDKIGSAYTFTCIDAHSKLIVAWHLGRRTEKDTQIFLRKVRSSVQSDTPFQISTDSFPAYKYNVPIILGRNAHYGQITKTYASSQSETRYSPAVCTGCKKTTVMGNPIREKISTSYVERANLTMRMSMRRFTRLTNAFSKKWENHNYTLALHFAYYNFVRGHKTLDGATPAMAANITKTFWTLKDILNVATQD